MRERDCPAALREAAENGRATPTRNENEGWMRSCSERADPGHVALVMAEERPEGRTGARVRHRAGAERLGQEQQHDEATVLRRRR